MKKINLLAIAALVLAAASCSKDGNIQSTYWVSYGMVEDASADNLLIKSDDGALLRVVENLVPGVSLKADDRIVFNYDLRPDTQANSIRNIRLNDVKHILCKPPIRESFILQDERHRRDSIGDDPIEVYYTWFGGKYLNVRFGVRHSITEALHMVSLVYRDTPPAGGPEEYQEFSLKHKSPGSLQGEIGIGYVSFDISGLFSEAWQAEGVKIKLSWRNYAGATLSETGTFRPYWPSNPSIPDREGGFVNQMSVW